MASIEKSLKKSRSVLVVLMTGWWFGTFFIFPYIGNIIIPNDKLIFFRGVGIPPTRWLFMMELVTNKP
jgi:hypothetical protein